MTMTSKQLTVLFKSWIAMRDASNSIYAHLDENGADPDGVLHESMCELSAACAAAHAVLGEELGMSANEAERQILAAQRKALLGDACQKEDV